MKIRYFLTALLLFFILFHFTKGAIIEIKNPLNATSFEALISSILNFLKTVSLVVGPIILVVAGYFFVTSMGDPQKVSQAKKMVIYTLIGVLIIVLAEGIVNVIKSVFQTKK